MKPPPEPIGYASAKPRREWPQGELGGVSAVLGVAIVVLTLFALPLHLLAASDTNTTRWMRIEAWLVGVPALIGVLLALFGLRQRGRRTSAAVFGLVVNALILTLAVVGLMWL